VPLDLAVVGSHLRQMAREPDSLIRRKLGDEVAREAQRRAAEVLGAGWPEARGAQAAFNRLDRWLRGDGRRRNPGASADLVAAALFACLREGAIAWPAAWSSDLPEQAPPGWGGEGVGSP
jgi:triphosphoribosyl-dephospho-CoA synthase